MSPMRGPLPSYRPEFPSTFLKQAEKIVRHRTVKYQLRQRATLVLLLDQQPLLSNVEAAERVRLHLRSVQRWRHRWAQGDFSLDDEPGRGRKADFSQKLPESVHSYRFYVEAGLPKTRVLLWVYGEQLRAVLDHVVLAEYRCGYDGRTHHVKEMRDGVFYATRFASPQGALIPLTPHESLIVYRPKPTGRLWQPPVSVQQ